MNMQDLTGRALDVLRETLAEAAEPECTRLLVSDAVVVREGNHFRIEAGAGDGAELEAIRLRLAGRCDCGAPLSRRGERMLCRTCCREFRWQ
jgi:hypothetical protein